MMNTYSNLLVSFLLLTVFTISCNVSSSDEASHNIEFTDGLSEHVWELITPKILEIIEEELQMPIHRGDDPPQVPVLFEKQALKDDDEMAFDTYHILERTLKSTNIPNDTHLPGVVYPEGYLRIYNQSMENLTVSFDFYEKNTGFFRAVDVPIIGNNNHFTIFSVVRGEYFGHEEIEGLYIISGSFEDFGISGYNSTNYMIDNAGDDAYIPNNTGRTIFDDAGLAELTTWPGEAQPGNFKKLFFNEEE